MLTLSRKALHSPLEGIFTIACISRSPFNHLWPGAKYWFSHCAVLSTSTTIKYRGERIQIIQNIAMKALKSHTLPTPSNNEIETLCINAPPSSERPGNQMVSYNKKRTFEQPHITVLHFTQTSLCSPLLLCLALKLVLPHFLHLTASPSLSPSLNTPELSSSSELITLRIGLISVSGTFSSTTNDSLALLS